MKLSLLLYIVKIKLMRRARRDPAFGERLKERNFTLFIGTTDKRRGRYFKFEDGKLTSGRGVPQTWEVALLWKNPNRAFKIMKSGNRGLSQEAVAEGELIIRGSLHHSLWFNEVVRIMMNF